MKRLIMMTAYVALSASILALGLAACTATRAWQYPPDPPGTLLDLKGSAPVPAKLVVLRLSDARGNNTQLGSWRVALPFVLSGVNSFDRPEAVQETDSAALITMDPPRDFAMAIAEELKHAGVFSSVAFGDAATRMPDLILSGTIRSTNWKRTYTAYGLGPIGALFWVLGAPMGNTTNTVTLDLQLMPAGEPRRVLWQFSMQAEDTHPFGVYYGKQRSVTSYAEALQETLKPAIANLIATAKEHPEILRPMPSRQ